ncbi:beta-ketoacyl-ACP synthase II [Ornithobacterium rhinotracheale]|uniref:3-oxoacyl-[acyl-carrier-protein] synthase 2 n=1 Tax=Ornithobacterium rhinotracheale (strain ATCC 51463 / DSM 15997 / CCUG 23171 / CIP 104009 / LMG 9086) TaxID=867902 RepID=I4A0H1_ORNRL|nr:beta-ketoacyl-ACP synthase II [Ornithobacterium rhinotracheale]AFL97455.1 beta-ketoacyl-acyl-carrier-protein synthase II [Ornithobacterium rhinotracheale DSM 15997]AIP99001.1 3-oxoacyl-ACP synthase [Ornithobacterium rhinotracheale ORT-UMN 88]MBN3661976.1 beta-ketoacyl-ACP synthase II [Ornithobacterium rhinotracheale]MCK0195178.1 beta-ketoacyl-ACP synthase II [Ornithobacterium rhinotracheale]MCK0202098.1 beta-ketoacyl-ACP synthase II [Ornithobacterium rhinotracheale]
MKLKRVVITGLGALTPIGNTYNEYWNNLLKGVSGAAPITLFDASQFKTQFACEVKNFDPLQHFDKKEVRKMDRTGQLGIVAAREAVENSGILEASNLDKTKIGVIWGSGIGGLLTFEQEVSNYATGNGTPRFNPFFIPKMIADITPGLISMEFGFMGPNYTTVSACASSSNAIIDAFNLIRLGKADAIVTGGSEAAITAAGIGGFNALHALSTRNDDPATASRPFDKDRDGFVMGEGAGVMILEEYDHAVARGATIYAEVAGGGMSADAYHMTAPHPDGLGVYHVMKNTLEDANIQPNEVDHINMHATSTPLGDIAEPKAVVDFFGDHAKNIQINATKSMHGHLLGATGAVEAIATIGAVYNGIVPPTINLHEKDEKVADLDYTFNAPKEKEIRYAMSNTFGFGGHNACVLFKKYS